MAIFDLFCFLRLLLLVAGVCFGLAAKILQVIGSEL